MYTTCLFCHSDLGSNEVIESFPVGRRLAFDAAQGRLWVVCRRCERWNLTPLEERWEAIEQCERLFSATRLKVSTDNIGLSRLREGLELVRIGNPQRPEMAAWRYGDQFGRRRRRYVAYTAGGVAVAAGLVVAGPMMGFSIVGGGWGMFQGISAMFKAARDRTIRTRVALPGVEKAVVLRGREMKRVVLGSDGDRWNLRIPVRQSGGMWQSEVTLHDADALRVASTILPAVNHKGGKKEHVAIAVSMLETTPDANRLFVRTAASATADRNLPNYARRQRRDRRPKLSPSEVFLDRIDPITSLALEMAAHEDIERRAMEGELSILEAAWRQAEEIASISDNLLMPSSVDDEYEKLAKKADPSLRSG